MSRLQTLAQRREELVARSSAQISALVAAAAPIARRAATVDPAGAAVRAPPMLSAVVVGGFPWSALLPLAFQHAVQGWRGPRAVADARGVDVAPLVRDVREVGASSWFVACAACAAVPLVVYPSPPLTASFRRLRAPSLASV